MSFIKAVLIFALTTVFSSNIAFAEGKKLAEKLAGKSIIFKVELPSCDSDAKKLCPGLPLNSKKSFTCLMAYEDNLSTECKVGIVEAAITLGVGMMAIDYSLQSCEADADKHCLNVEPGDGRIVGCLKKNESVLSKQCVSALKETGLWNLGTD